MSDFHVDKKQILWSDTGSVPVSGAGWAVHHNRTGRIIFALSIVYICNQHGILKHLSRKQ